MRRRVLSVALSLMMAASMGLALAPAAGAQPDGGVFLSEPSLDEYCDFVGDFLDDELLDELEDGEVPEDLDELMEELNGFGDLGPFQPQPADEERFADLRAALDELLDGSEDADHVFVEHIDGDTFIFLLPDLRRCEGFEDIDLPDDFDLGAGVFVVEPTLEELCAFFEEDFLDDDFLDDFDEEDFEFDEDFDFDEDDFDEDEFEELDPFFPEELTGEEAARFAPLVEQLEALLAASEEAVEITVFYDGETLLVTLLPDIELCDFPEEPPVEEPVDDTTPVGGVATGAGGANSGGATAPAALLVTAILALAAVAVRRRVTA